MLNDGIVCVLPLWLMWHVLCFRVWIQFWVVIHHCATRSGIQGGGIRGLVLLTLSQYFFQHLFSKLWVLTECLVGFFGEVLFRNKWLLPGVLWFSNNCWCFWWSSNTHTPLLKWSICWHTCKHVIQFEISCRANLCHNIMFN